ncbi:hypothetical protein SH661x_001624 [Planctomicrobium sp. SH661]|uniref:hypothetical protein n=1 Tax=Planctomicrobium sp. SH661 TaxID=3448124 RepID=UPI003F5C0366
MKNVLSKVSAFVPSVAQLRRFAPCLLAAVVMLCFSAAAFAQEGGGGGSFQVYDVITDDEWNSIVTAVGTKVGSVIKGMLTLAVGMLLVGLGIKLLRRYTTRGV